MSEIRNVTWHESKDSHGLGWYWTGDLFVDGKRIGVTGNYYELDQRGWLRERFAAVAHEQWSGWMKYLFDQCTVNVDGSLTIPVWASERWGRQMTTPYAELPESEKESDRTEADKVLAIIACPGSNAD